MDSFPGIGSIQYLQDRKKRERMVCQNPRAGELLMTMAKVEPPSWSFAGSYPAMVRIMAAHQRLKSGRTEIIRTNYPALASLLLDGSV